MDRTLFYEYFVTEYSIPDKNYDDPCANCPNNPANNPLVNGMCNCILGSLKVTC